MNMPDKRVVVQIDQEKCDGCGLCVPSCEEGAIQVVDGKARLVSDVYCDGLGACLGHCPQDAITLIERPADPFDEQAVARHLAEAGSGGVGLTHWPIQLALVSPDAPFLQGADILLVADCVPFVCSDFHARFLDGRPVLVACPKLDNGPAHVKKLARIIQAAHPRRLSVLHTAVPCCTGLMRIAHGAVKLSGREVPVDSEVIPIASDRPVTDSGSELPLA